MTFDELCERMDELDISGDTPVLIQDQDGYSYTVEDVAKDELGVATIIIEIGD